MAYELATSVHLKYDATEKVPFLKGVGRIIDAGFRNLDFNFLDMVNGSTMFLSDGYKEWICQCKESFEGDIHCLCSPDKQYILGDGYPDRDGYRPLFLYDTQTEEIKKLLRSKSTMDANWDIRCDLHARFNRQGNKISFDSTHDGKRHICEMELG